MESDSTDAKAHPSELFRTGFDDAVRQLRSVTDRDWTVSAGGLDWSCWQTVDHVADCIFSYSLQLAGRVRDGWLHLEELHAQPEATPGQLLEALTAVGNVFEAVLHAAPERAVASDGLFELGVSDWTARALNELLLHTHDVLAGLGKRFEPSGDVCAFVLASPTLWMYDGIERAGPDAWTTMLVGSGRPTSAA